MGLSLERIALEAIALVAPLPSYFASPDAATEIFKRLGYTPSVADLAPIVGDIGALANDINTLVEIGETFQTELEAGTAGPEELQNLIAEIGKILDDLSKLPGKLSALNLSASFITDVLSVLLVDYLNQRRPSLRAMLEFVGALDQTYLPAQAGSPAVGFNKISLRWGRLLDLMQRPSDWAQGLYGWGTSEFLHTILLLRLSSIFDAIGLFAPVVEIPTDILTTFFPSGANASSRPQAIKLPVYRQQLDPNASVEIGLVGLPVDGKQVPLANDIGIGLMPYSEGVAEGALAISPELTLLYRGSADVAGGLVIALRPNSGLDLTVGGQSNVASSGQFRLELRRTPAPGTSAIVLIGEPDSMRLDAKQLSFSGGVEVFNLIPDVLIGTGFSGCRLVITTGAADGFLSNVLPPNGLQAMFDFGVKWSHTNGLHFEGSGALETTLPLNTTQGPIHLNSLWISLGVAQTGLTFEFGVTGGISIGPVAASIDRIGMKMYLQLAQGNFGPIDLGFGFRPPNGLGVAIDAGPVSGGGYLYFDPTNEQYAGVLQLAIQNKISLTAIALLTTRLPDASAASGATKRGFSLLAIITADFPPLPLGYGFTLDGVGGMLGVNRTMDRGVLSAGVRDGSIGTILFPQDPVARAPEIISRLRSIFPPAQNRYVFGPMVKIGWGPDALLEFEAALVLELSSPIRLAAFGQIRADFPNKKVSLLRVRLDFWGEVDFDRCEASLWASLVDSRLVGFALSGDMALRAGWGATKMFALSAGGFFPRFQPPTGFPTLRRLTIALADSDNPRLRLESYLAITTNTLQFGAALDLYAEADTFAGLFSVSANLTFDTLIQFAPFSFIADLSTSVSVAHDGDPFLQAFLSVSLSGPTPWHAVGYAEFDCFGKHRVDFNATIGTADPAPLPAFDPHDILTQIKQAFEQIDAWAALPPDSHELIVTLRNGQQAGTSAVAIHPLGNLSARQRVVPLGQTIDRFGTSTVTPVTFSLQSFGLGSGADEPQAEDLYDDFAPGQFNSLTDDQRLARPAFESMRSGGRVQAAAFKVPSMSVTQALDYDESIIDFDPTTKASRSAAPAWTAPAPMSATTLAAIAQAGAAGRSRMRAPGAARFAGPDLSVGVGPERYVAAGADSLSRFAGAPNESAVEAHQRRQVSSSSEPATQVALSFEAA